MTVDGRRPALRWLVTGGVLIALVIAVIAVVALRSGPRDLPEATIVRDCPAPSGGPPAQPQTRRGGPLVPGTEPTAVRLCRGDPERDSAPLPYDDLTDGTGQVVAALNALPGATPGACADSSPPRIVDLVLDYPAGRIVVSLSTEGCGPVHSDGQTRYGARQMLDLTEGLIRSA